MQCCDSINCLDKGMIRIPETELPRVVVVGGGFAGLNVIKGLKNLPLQVVLIDRNNFHQFLPLLYQVATSGKQPDNIVFPFRKLFKITGISFSKWQRQFGLTPGAIRYKQQRRQGYYQKI